jgi:hypothetical protein
MRHVISDRGFTEYIEGKSQQRKGGENEGK